MNRHTSWQHLVFVVGVALLVAVMSSMLQDVLAHPKGFVFTPLAFLGDPASGGGVFLDVFESNFINNRGDVLFGSNLAPGEPPKQGLFLLRKGEIAGIARAGKPAPGGGDYDFGFLSPTTLNDRGDVGFVWLLEHFCFPDPSDPSNECPPIGVNAGVYRFSQSTHMVTPVVIPEVTEVPGGGVFKGAQFGVSLNNRGDLVFGGIVQTEQGIYVKDAATGDIQSIAHAGTPRPAGACTARPIAQ